MLLLWIARLDLTKTEASLARNSGTSTSGGYRKGDEARQRIIKVALKQFDAAGFKGTTTRQIASEAGVTLPALQYYFGGKLGLYRVCAEEVVLHYWRLVEFSSNDAAVIFDADSDPEIARAQLKALVRALVTLPSQTSTWAQFVFREIGEPGPAFDVLYQGLWDPCISIVADLIRQIEGKDAKPLNTRIQALLLLSSLLAFQGGQKFSLRVLGLQRMGVAETKLVLDHLDRQIDVIGKA